MKFGLCNGFAMQPGATYLHEALVFNAFLFRPGWLHMKYAPGIFVFRLGFRFGDSSCCCRRSVACAQTTKYKSDEKQASRYSQPAAHHPLDGVPHKNAARLACSLLIVA